MTSARSVAATGWAPEHSDPLSAFIDAHPELLDLLASKADLRRFESELDSRRLPSSTDQPTNGPTGSECFIDATGARAATDGTPSTWLACWDSGLACTYVDPAIPAWWTSTPTGLPGLYVDGSSQRQVPPLLEPYLHAALAGNATTVQLWMTAPDGGLRQVQVRVCPQHADDAVRGVYALFTDVTEYHTAMNRLRLLETCLSRLNDIVLITDAEPFDEPGPRIVYVNDAFERRTGYRREEVIGQTPRILQGPNTDPSELRRIGVALRRWESVRSQLINYTKTGEPFWLELDIVPVADASGWFTHWIAVERDITDRKRAEVTLREAKERLRFALDSAEIGDWTMDLSSGIVVRSLQHARCFGYTEIPELWGYQTVLAPVHATDRARVDQSYRAARAGQGDYDVEFRVTWPDESIHWLWSKGRFYFDDSGHAYRIAGILVDVTRRREMEEQRAATARRLEIVTDTANLGLWDWNLKTDEVFLSPIWKRQLGYEHHELADSLETWRSRIHPDDVERSLAATIDYAARARGDYKLEHRLRHRDGSYRIVQSTATLVLDDDGRPLRMLGSNLDLTEIRAAEAARRESESILRGVIENSPVPYVLTGHFNEILYVNPAFVAAIGYTLADIPTVTEFRRRAFASPQYRQWAVDEIEARVAAADGGAAFEPLEVEVTGKDDQVRMFLLRVVTLTGTAEVRRLKVLFDVTEQRRLEKAFLEAASREQHRLGLDLHDGLGQELTGLSLWLSVLSKKVLTADVRASASELEQLAALASDCVTSARRIAHGLSPVELAEGGLRGALDRLIRALNITAPDVDVRLQIEGGALQDTHAAVGEAAYRIVQEAISNAVRHGQATRIVVRAEKADSELRVSVSDNGRGIANDVKRDGMGMNIMRYRARALRGNVTFRKTTAGGVSMQCVIPSPSPTHAAAHAD